MENIKEVINNKKLISIIYNTYNLYLINGSRSSKKVNYFHNKIKDELELLFINNNNNNNIYKIKLEQNIASLNASGKKKCDIVVFKNNNPFIIFPVKIIMSNYKQNKNNSWENLTGELIHIKWLNQDVNLIPINIFMNKTPYLDNKKIIKKFENITYNDIKNYDILKEKNICYDVINYIIDIEHNNFINEYFTNLPNIIGFNKNTKFRSFEYILKNLI